MKIAFVFLFLVTMVAIVWAHPSIKARQKHPQKKSQIHSTHKQISHRKSHSHSHTNGKRRSHRLKASIKHGTAKIANPKIAQKQPVPARNETTKKPPQFPKKNRMELGPHTFDYLLGDDNHITSEVSVIFVDYEIDASVIQRYKTEGKTVICYVNVGAWEEWRPDANDFPEEVLGNDYEGWPGERWLDIRETDILLPIMRKRYDEAAAKGCEGIDPDNMNGYIQDSGFDLSYDDQITFNTLISEEAWERGMLAGLKNDHDQAEDLVWTTDFAVVEECAQYDECWPFSVFVDEGKPVFVIEYTEGWDEDTFRNEVCPMVEETSMSFILKEYDLHGDYIVSCLEDSC